MAETNFFKPLAEIAKGLGSVVIACTVGDDGIMSVSVLPKAKAGVEDPALKSLSPVIMSGSPQEVDLVFFEQLAKPVSTAKGLYSSVEEFEKNAEEVKKKTKMEMEKASKEKKDKEAMDKKAKEAIASLEANLAKKDFGSATKLFDQLSKISETQCSPAVWKQITKAVADARTGLAVTAPLFESTSTSDK